MAGHIIFDKDFELNSTFSGDVLMKGTTLDFDMSAAPNTKRRIKKEDFPYSLTNE